MPGRRRTIVVKQEFQFRFAIMLIVLVVIVANLMGGMVYLFLTNKPFLRWLADMFYLVDEEDAILPAILLVEAICILVVGFISIYVSHAMAGPVYRLEKEIKAIAEGDLSHFIRLRKGDEFVELADALNYLIEQYRERLMFIKEKVDSILNSSNLEEAKDFAGDVAAILETFVFEREEVKEETTLEENAVKVSGDSKRSDDVMLEKEAEESKIKENGRGRSKKSGKSSRRGRKSRKKKS